MRGLRKDVHGKSKEAKAAEVLRAEVRPGATRPGKDYSGTIVPQVAAEFIQALMSIK